MILLKNINFVPERVDIREIIQNITKLLIVFHKLYIKLLILINSFVIFAR